MTLQSISNLQAKSISQISNRIQFQRKTTKLRSIHQSVWSLKTGKCFENNQRKNEISKQSSKS